MLMMAFAVTDARPPFRKQLAELGLQQAYVLNRCAIPKPSSWLRVGGNKGLEAQEAVTLSLLAQLPVVLPKLEDELGAKQLHLGVRGQHL